MVAGQCWDAGNHSKNGLCTKSLRSLTTPFKVKYDSKPVRRIPWEFTALALIRNGLGGLGESVVAENPYERRHSDSE